MSNKIIYRIIQIFAVLFALMYVVSFYEFAILKQITFIHYLPQTNVEIWVVRNLGIRLLAIAVGFFIALGLRSKIFLAAMFAIRIVADVGDLINSAITPNLESSVAIALSVFVSIELICLLLLVKLIKEENKK